MSHLRGGIGSNQYETKSGGVLDIRREDAGEIASAAQTLETDVSADDVADIFSGVNTWADAFPTSHVQRERFQHETSALTLTHKVTAEETWMKAGVLVPAQARRLAGSYQAAGLENDALAGAFYEQDIPPAEAVDWMASLDGNPSLSDIQRIGSIRLFVSPERFRQLCQGHRPLRPTPGCSVHAVVALAAWQPTTDPAVLRRTIQNLAGVSRKRAAEWACKSIIPQMGLWSGQDDYRRAARQSVWRRRLFHPRPQRYGR